MNTLKQVINEIKTQLTKSPVTMAQELVNASGYELGLRHTNGAFALIRDDKVVELNAGNNTSVVVDGPGQAVGINSTGTTIQSNILQFKVPTSNIYFNYQAINPFWFTNNPLDIVSPFFK